MARPGLWSEAAGDGHAHHKQMHCETHGAAGPVASNLGSSHPRPEPIDRRAQKHAASPPIRPAVLVVCAASCKSMIARSAPAPVLFRTFDPVAASIVFSTWRWARRRPGSTRFSIRARLRHDGFLPQSPPPSLTPESPIHSLSRFLILLDIHFTISLFGWPILIH